MKGSKQWAVGSGENGRRQRAEGRDPRRGKASSQLEAIFFSLPLYQLYQLFQPYQPPTLFP
jgi:hypothetical protein